MTPLDPQPETDAGRPAARPLWTLGPLALYTVGGPAVGAGVLAATSDRWWPPLAALPTLEAVLLFVGAAAVLAGLSIIPTHAASLVGGLLLGAVGGSALALLAVGLAALLGFLLMRPLAAGRTARLLADHPRAAAVHGALFRQGPRRTFGLIALVRLSPVMPFAATNLVMAAAGVRLPVFLAGSLVGLAPRVVLVAVAGAGLAELDLSRGVDSAWAVAGLAATVLLLAVLGRIGRRAWKQAVT